MVETYITPAILVGIMLFVWRDLSRRMDRDFKNLRDDLGGRIDRLNDRLDKHLEGHPS